MSLGQRRSVGAETEIWPKEAYSFESNLYKNVGKNTLLKRLITVEILFTLVPSTLIVIGLWAEPIRPAIMDFSELALLPGIAIFVLGTGLGALWAVHNADHPITGVSAWIDGGDDNAIVRPFVVVSTISVVLAAVAGGIGTLFGQFNQYSLLFWICALYGIGAVAFLQMDRVERSTDGAVAE